MKKEESFQIKKRKKSRFQAPTPSVDEEVNTNFNLVKLFYAEGK